MVGWGGMQGDSALGKNYPWRRALIWVGAGLVLAVLRCPSTFSAPQFWAEDASVFFHQADHLGGQALNLPHAGYHHLAMRLWAGFWVGIGAPVVAMPALFVFGATLGWLAVGLLVFSPRLDLRWRGALIMALALVPPTHEVRFNLTNAQWTLALLWPLWWSARDPRTRSGVVTESVAMAVVGLTGIFAILAAPFFVLRAVWRRTWPAVIAATVVVSTAVIQWGALHTAQAGGGTERAWTWGEAVLLLGKRVMGQLCLPATLSAATLMWGGLLLAVGLLGWWSWRARPDAAVRPLGMWLAFGAAVALASLWRFPESLRPLHGGFNGDRYFWIPKLLVVWTLVQLTARADGRMRWGGVAWLVLVLAVALTHFRLQAWAWHNWPMWAERIERGEEVRDVPITPDGMMFYYSANSRRQERSAQIGSDGQ